MDRDKFVDESWKESAEKEKESLNIVGDSMDKSSKLHVQEPIKEPENTEEQGEQLAEPQKQDVQDSQMPEINFINYVTSLGFQILIFLGEMPSPVTNQVEKNLDQAKFLIDTLVMLREKTKGNLNDQEDNLLSASIYELQLKYVEIVNNKDAQPKD